MTLEDETATIFAMIGQAITAWGGLEQNLSMLFSACSSPSVSGRNMGYVGGNAVTNAVFHSNDSLHAKLNMLTAAISLGIPPSKETDAIVVAWGNAERRIRQQSKKRNRLAHWSVIRFGEAPTMQRMRLMPPPFDPARRDHGGHTIADIRSWTLEFSATDLEIISPLVSAVGQHRGLHELWANGVSAMLHNLNVAGNVEESEYLRQSI